MFLRQAHHCHLIEPVNIQQSQGADVLGYLVNVLDQRLDDSIRDLRVHCKEFHELGMWEY